MGLESATYISELVTSNPTATDLEAQGDDHLRLIKASLQSTFPAASKATYIQQAEATVTSASPDLGAATSDNVSITGTTAITSFGTTTAGVIRRGRFTGILTLTHNATSLILPGAANITTAANDRFEALSLGSGNWLVLWFTRASGLALAAFASGTIMTFGNSTAPTGWTKGSTHDNKAMRLVTGTPSTGGSVGFTTAFASQTPAGTVSGTPSLSATVSQNGWGVDAGTSSSGRLITSTGGSNPSGTGTATGAGTLSISANTWSGSFTGSAINLAVNYVDMILATKD
jgi:hypothetical protein